MQALISNSWFIQCPCCALLSFLHAYAWQLQSFDKAKHSDSPMTSAATKPPAGYIITADSIECRAVLGRTGDGIHSSADCTAIMNMHMHVILEAFCCSSMQPCCRLGALWLFSIHLRV
ncbi:TPA: hypothetical protein ACH3X1_010618 [Trebouxia sp. C0004]